MRELLENVFAICFFFLPFVATYFLIRKNHFNSFAHQQWSRPKIGLFFFILLIAFFIGFAVTSDGVPAQDQESVVLGTQYEEPTATPSAIPSATPVTIPASTPSPTLVSNKELVKVVNVIDGDTVELENGSRLRYIGIDTPETKHPTKPVECYGNEAYQKNKELVEGKMVELEKDVNEVDRYGRLLRYIYVDGVMINEYLVKEGYAYASSYPPDVKHQEQLKAAQAEAMNFKKGLWGDSCVVKLTPTPTPTPLPAKQATSSPTESTTCKYSCTGPDKDCADFSSHADAQTFFNCCGFTANNDPMRLDSAKGVGNGLACESR